MKQLTLLFLLLTSLVYGQPGYIQTGFTVSRKDTIIPGVPNAKAYRANLGSPGYAYFPTRAEMLAQSWAISRVTGLQDSLYGKQKNLGIVNVRDFGAVGDGVTDDTEAIANAIAAGNTIYFPKTSAHYRASINNTKSNMTFIFEEGVVIDGDVVHLAIGRGPGVDSWNNGDPIIWVDNIRVIGKLATTERVGTYYARNIYIDEIEIMANSPSYLEQTSDGGSRGIHFYWGTKNVYINKIVTRSTKSGEPRGGLFIDGNETYPAESVPSDFHINQVVVEESEWNGIYLYLVENLKINNAIVKNAQYEGVVVSTSSNTKISNLTVSNTTTSLYYTSANQLWIGNFISNTPSVRDVYNDNTPNVSIGYTQDLVFNSSPYADQNFNRIRVAYADTIPTTGMHYEGERIYNVNPSANQIEGWVCTSSGSPGTWTIFGYAGDIQDLIDNTVSAYVPLSGSSTINGNITLGSGAYGSLNIKGSTGAIIDYFKGSTLLGEMGMEEVDANTSAYKFYTRSGGATSVVLNLTGNTATFPSFPAFSSATSGRIPYFTTGGQITDDADLTFDGAHLSVATPTASGHAVNKGYADATFAPLSSPTFSGTVSGITKSMVGLGNVDNTADANKPVSTATQTALDLKANLVSPSFSGAPTAPTATAGTNTTQLATTEFVQTALSGGVTQTTGSWTPANGTISTASGSYIKTGKQVTAYFDIVFSASGSGSAFALGGLPFSNNSSVKGTLTLGYSNLGAFTGEVAVSSTNVFFYKTDGSSLLLSDISGKTIRGMLTYYTN